MSPAEIIYKARRNKRLTIRKFAYLVNMIPSHLSEMENGKRELPMEPNKIKDIENALDLEPGTLTKKTLEKEYKKYEFCESIKCKLLENLKQGKKTPCLFCDAYKFHDYIQVQGYKIIKASRISFLEEGNKAMAEVLTSIAHFLDVEQGNVEQLLEAIEDLKNKAGEPVVSPELTCAACGKETNSLKPVCEECE